MSARVLVVQNAERTSLGRLEKWWAEDGLDLDVVRAYAGEPIPDLDPSSDAAGLVLLGGGLMPDADEQAPWLPRERAVTAAAIEAGLSILGICLGGQLLAHVAGGKVRAKHGQAESGSTTLTRRAAAAGDLLFDPLPETFSAIEHRVDMITELPPGAAWLASSEACPIQGFRVGRCAWGVQFHPEVDADGVASWSQDGLRRGGFDPVEVVRRARADEPSSEPVWRAFATRFAEVVQRSQRRS